MRWAKFSFSTAQSWGSPVVVVWRALCVSSKQTRTFRDVVSRCLVWLSVCLCVCVCDMAYTQNDELHKAMYTLYLYIYDSWSPRHRQQEPTISQLCVCVTHILDRRTHPKSENQPYLYIHSSANGKRDVPNVCWHYIEWRRRFAKRNAQMTLFGITPHTHTYRARLHIWRIALCAARVETLCADGNIFRTATESSGYWLFGEKKDDYMCTTHFRWQSSNRYMLLWQSVWRVYNI